MIFINPVDRLRFVLGISNMCANMSEPSKMRRGNRFMKPSSCVNVSRIRVYWHWCSSTDLIQIG
jgi:hypothetical protein